MFDIGFWELVAVGAVGLLVLGPERLPGAVRTGSLWLNRLRRSFADIKRDIEREVGADELKRDLHNQRIMDSLRETRDQVAGELDQVAGELKETRRQLRATDHQGAPDERRQTADPREPGTSLPDDLPYDISGVVRPPPSPESPDQSSRS